VKKRSIKVVTACHNANGESDFALTVVKATEGQIEAGDHYDMARESLQERRYEGPFVHFDEDEAPDWLLEAVADKAEVEKDCNAE
jgi:hypothetical protein